MPASKLQSAILPIHIAHGICNWGAIFAVKGQEVPVLHARFCVDADKYFATVGRPSSCCLLYTVLLNLTLVLWTGPPPQFNVVGDAHRFCP